MRAARKPSRFKVHGILAGAGVAVPMSDLFGVAGLELLDRVSHRLGEVDHWRLLSLRRVGPGWAATAATARSG